MTGLQQSSHDEVSYTTDGVHWRNLRWYGPGFFLRGAEHISVGPGEFDVNQRNWTRFIVIGTRRGSDYMS